MRLLLAAATVLSGCAVLGFVDNGTHLAYALERGARELRASNDSEHVIRYEPLGQGDETYAITIRHSTRQVQVDMFGNIDRPGGSHISVTGRHRGGTGYHERFVFVPRDLHIVKTGAATEVVLRKSGDRIDVVELR